MTRSADNQTLPEAISSPLDGHTMTPAVAEPTSVNVLASAINIDNRLRPQRSLWGNAWFQFRKHRLAMIGLVIFVFMVLATFVGSAIYPQEIDEIDFSAASGALSWAHPMGTDSMGQDQLARILWGGRISLSVGIFAALFAIIVGTLVGALAGFFGGPTETLLMRITDMFISLPQLPLLLVISFLFKQQVYDYFEEHFGSGVLGIFVLIVFVIAIHNWKTTTRLVHASVLCTTE
ncbi:MAG: ABC transporter permease [Chloroflexota bacterium]